MTRFIPFNRKAHEALERKAGLAHLRAIGAKANNCSPIMHDISPEQERTNHVAMEYLVHGRGQF